MSKWFKPFSKETTSKSKQTKKRRKEYGDDDSDDNDAPNQYSDPSNSYNNHHSHSNGHNQRHARYNASRAGLTKSGDKLYVGDKILLANKRSGKVTSLGPKPDKEGIWVRVVMDNPHTTADQMYNEKNQKNKTIWVPIQRVDRIITKGKKFDLTIDDRVMERKKGIPGCIKYVGPTHFDKGVWFGVALDAPRGKNNGTVKKKFYFSTEANHGVMLPYKRLEHESKSKKKKQRKGRSHSNGFEKKPDSLRKEKNGLTRNKPSAHHKTQSDGVVNKGHLAQQLQLDMIHREQQQQQQQQILEEMTKKEKKKHATSNSNSSSLEEYIEETNANETPSSDSDVQNMFASIPNKEKYSEKLVPKELIPFQGWMKLVSGQMPVLDDAKQREDHDEDQLVVSRYQLEQDDETVRILSEFLTQSKEFTGIEKDLYESELPSITEVNKEERENIFVEKLYLCGAKCDFFDTSDQMIELIEKKERMLLELSEFIARHVWFKESLYEKCLVTVSFNLFRALPFQDRPPALSFFNDEVFDKDTNFEDPAWRHLKLVYDLTWRVINTPQVTAGMMEKHMTGKFLGNLVELFASEDHRERAYLMMILHKIYGRCLKLRPYIIEIMSSYFYRMIYYDEFQHVNGIIELLQIICAIIPGLTVPVKDSWQCFVRNILVPLHKCRGLKKFWEQLTQCCVNYVAKDEDGGAVILGGLLKFWPQQSPQKEEIFIMEVVNIINVLITHQHGFSYESYKQVLVCAANKLTQCMLSTRQPVAERAIAAWKEQSMQRLVDYDRKAFLPKLCEAFYRNREHPNAALKQSSTAVEKIYRSKDSAYWKKMQQYLAKKDKKETAVAKAIADAQMKHKDPYDIVKAKHAKDAQKHKRPKPLTEAEKSAKRAHFWKKVEKAAKINKQKLMRDTQQLQNKYSNSSSSLEPPNLST
eukprot:89261_1